MAIRGFEKISIKQFKKDFSKYNNVDKLYGSLEMPRRSTKMAAGYDFVSPVNFALNPNQTVKIPTGIKVKMLEGEVLQILIRSSLGFKYNIRLCNQAGIIDADYYNNCDNEGHIWLAFHNHGTSTWNVQKGDRIVQGIFLKFLISDDSDYVMNERKGGMGSTDRRDDNER